MQVLNPQDGMEAIKIVQWNRMEIVSRETQLENMSIRDINELRRCNQLMQQKFSTTVFFGYHIFRQTNWRTATKVSLLSETTCQNDAAKRMIWTPGFAVSLGGGIFRLAVPSIASRWESIFCWRFSQPHVRDEYGWLHLVMLIKPSAFTGWFPSSVT